jgi:phage shock protein A
VSLVARLRATLSRAGFRGRAAAGPASEPGRAAGGAGGPEPGSAAAVELEQRRLQEELASLRRSIVEATMGRRHLEGQAVRLSRRVEQLHADAAADAGAGRDGHARAALREALTLERRLAERRKTIDRLRRSQRELESSSARLQARLEACRIRADAARAREAKLEARGGGSSR